MDVIQHCTNSFEASENEAQYEFSAIAESSPLTAHIQASGLPLGVFPTMQLHSLIETAKMLAVSEAFILVQVENGALPFVDLDDQPRFLAEDIRAFVSKHRRRARTPTFEFDSED